MPPSSSPGSGTFALRAPTSAPGAWSAGRPFNAGLATGPAGLLVVDCDTRTDPDDLTAGPPEECEGATGGVDVLALLAERAGATLPATFTVTTPSGGTHFYYRAPSGVELRNTAGLLGWKIDTRAHGGYVVAPGSTTSASAYTVTDGRPVAELPGCLPGWLAGWLLQRLRPAPPSQSGPVRGGAIATWTRRYGLEQRGSTRRRPRVVDALGHRKP
ncbi:MAG: hypothetical protein QOG20_2037 [Pseudonocardiales bacterium]|nr:hypothetical protein [Pseudonocardiales bacterium]